MTHWELLGDAYGVLVTPAHSFGADALLLADFVPTGLKRLCEFGTGCGVISLVLHQKAAKRGETPPHITALDIQPDAVALATRSVAKNGLEGDISVLCADWRTFSAPHLFDAVVCNPPYFPPAGPHQTMTPARRVARHEDSPAALAELCAAATRWLPHGGRFILCHRPERLAELFAALRTAGLEPKRLKLVQHDDHTPPFLLLCEARRGVRPGLTIEPTLVEGGVRP